MINNEKTEFRSKEIEPTPSYVLSWDIPMLIDALCAFKRWKPPSQEVYNDVKSNVSDRLKTALSPIPLTVINGETIQNNIFRDVQQIKKYGYPIVSLDPIYAAGGADVQLNVTRGLNSDNSVTEIARPGYPDIPIQVQELKKWLGNRREIIVADVGAYSGESLLDLAKRLARENINIKLAVLGIVTDQAVETLRLQGIEVIARNNIGKPVDWIEARDFIPFTPLSGRVINEPLKTNGLSRSLSYIGPDASRDQMEQWASLKNSWIGMSLTGFTVADKLYQSIEQCNNIVVKLDDFIGLPIRVSYPGYADFNGTASVREVISKNINKIWEEGELALQESMD